MAPSHLRQNLRAADSTVRKGCRTFAAASTNPTGSYPFSKQKQRPPCWVVFVFGWGIGIRTPTNRVRVCRATVTQFPNGQILLYTFFLVKSRIFLLLFVFFLVLLKIMLVILKHLCYYVFCLGGVAQLGERLNGIQEVMGSIPTVSTKKRQSKDCLFLSKPQAWHIISPDRAVYHPSPCDGISSPQSRV